MVVEYIDKVDGFDVFDIFQDCESVQVANLRCMSSKFRVYVQHLGGSNTHNKLMAPFHLI